MGTWGPPPPAAPTKHKTETEPEAQTKKLKLEGITAGGPQKTKNTKKIGQWDPTKQRKRNSRKAY